MRIVTLLPSATEIVCSLGCADFLVGRSHECDFPPPITSLPVCTESKIHPEALSKEIDLQVKESVQKSLSLYRVHIPILKALRPDIIITQDQCEVCAVSLKELQEVIRQVLESAPQIVSLKTRRLSDLWEDMRKVAEVLHCAEKGEQLIRHGRQRPKDIIAQVPYKPRSSAVVCLEWLDPLMAAGSWIPEMVKMLHGENLFSKSGENAIILAWPDLLEKDPDIIILMPCGWDMERSRAELSVLSNRPGWSQLKAVRQRQVYLTNGNHYFNRPGPRLVDSLEILAEILYPEKFCFHYEGKAWQRLG